MMRAVQAVAMVVVVVVGGALATSPSSVDINLKIDDFQPQQVHIAVGETNEDMVVTWVTPSATSTSVVKFGMHDLDQTAEGTAQMFTDGGTEKRNFWIHRVTLSSLLPDTLYYYHCGSSYGWSDMFSFKTWKNGTTWPVSVAIYGDLGVANPQSLPRLQAETQAGMYDALIHVGDLAYDMHADNARVGDMFMRQIEPIAAYFPYMACPGNHESAYNFSNYKARFSMPNYDETESMYFSWNMGPIHFIAISTEAYYNLQFGMTVLSRQYEWLVQDLEEATKPEVREQRPWIIIFGHRPMYCSNSDGDDCTKPTCLTRVGLPVSHLYGMEKLLDEYGVDLAVWAHEHSYERLWPLFNYTVLNGSTTHPYTNPKGPVHVITGSAGCSEDHDNFMPDQPYWSAMRSLDYGYTRLKVPNNTHLYWEQVSDDKHGKVIDQVWLIRDEHVPYSQLRREGL